MSHKSQTVGLSRVTNEQAETRRSCLESQYLHDQITKITHQNSILVEQVNKATANSVTVLEDVANILRAHATLQAKYDALQTQPVQVENNKESTKEDLVDTFAGIITR